jgi:transaldolase
MNINITLIFSLENYRQVVEAYLSALEERKARGQTLKRVASVASFFVSRVDVLVDQLLEGKIKTTTLRAEQQKLRDLQGKIAIANARLVYQEFKRLFENPRFGILKHQGAERQRPLWASTSTKNPVYRDVLYAEELIGPDTVDTMPLKTVENFRDHGQVRYSIEDALPEASATLAVLEELGISYDQVTRQLQEEGIQRFADSFRTLLASINHRAIVL